MMPTYHIASEASAARVCDYIRARAGKGPIVVSIDKPKRLRTLKANARYWVLLSLIAENVKPGGTFFDKDRWHDYFVRRFLTPKEFTLPNGKVILEYPSTAILPATAEDAEEGEDNFQDYMTQVEVWAAEHGVVMPTFE